MDRFGQESGLPIIESLRMKPEPQRFSDISPKMVAIVGYILGQQWTNPYIIQLGVTPDGFVLARNEGDIGFDHFIGAESDLRRNWSTFLGVADLTVEELELAEDLYDEKVVPAE